MSNRERKREQVDKKEAFPGSTQSCTRIHTVSYSRTEFLRIVWTILYGCMDRFVQRYRQAIQASVDRTMVLCCLCFFPATVPFSQDVKAQV